MSDDVAPERIAVIWSTEARGDLRAIDRETALQILYCANRYLASRTGDVKKLKLPLSGFRPRCGDYRVFFDQKDDNTIAILRVRHRKDAYVELLPTVFWDTYRAGFGNATRSHFPQRPCSTVVDPFL